MENAAVLTKLFLEQIVILHGFPVRIVSNRDSKFKPALWKAMQKSMDTKVYMSTIYHPQMDGQLERKTIAHEDLPKACVLDQGGK